MWIPSRWRAAFVAEWPEAAETLARRYWPGPLTLVLPKRESIPDIVTAGLPTVGLRMPAHPLALALIRAAGVPIAAPSANRFTELSPTTAAHVPHALADFVLDGGPARVGIESTVLSLAGPPTLLRPGVIPLPEFEALIGPIAVAAGAGGRRARIAGDARAPLPPAHADLSAQAGRADSARPRRLAAHRPRDAARPARIRRCALRGAASVGSAGARLDRGGASAGNAGMGGSAGSIASRGGSAVGSSLTV